MIPAQALLTRPQAQNIISGFVGFIQGIYGLIQRQLHNFVYLFDGAEVINDAYIKVWMDTIFTSVKACGLTSNQAKGKPFEILTPGRRHRMVSSPLHLEEIDRAPLDVLSLHAVAKDVSCSIDALRFQSLALKFRSH
jgi:hypothetical protein